MSETLTVGRLQAEVTEWAARNFPDESARDVFEGIVEEIGELAHSRLKAKQNIRGTREEHEAAERDAIGDATIYLCDFARRAGIKLADDCTPLSECASHPAWRPRDPFLALVVGVGNLALDVGISGDGEGPARRARALLRELADYAVMRGWPFAEIVAETWSRVSRRDWAAHPDTGTGTAPPPAVDAAALDGEIA